MLYICLCLPLLSYGLPSKVSAYWRETDMVLFTTTSSVLKIMSERLFSKQMLRELSHISSLYKIPLFPHRIPFSSRVRGLTRVPQLVKGRAGIHPSLLLDPGPICAPLPTLPSPPWWSTQDIRSKETSLACVGGRSSMCHTRLFHS